MQEQVKVTTTCLAFQVQVSFSVDHTSISINIIFQQEDRYLSGPCLGMHH